MALNIKNYLHLYLPFSYKYFDYEYEVTGIEYKKKNWIRLIHENGFFEVLAEDVRLPLRPLSSMTAEEFEEFKVIADNDFIKMVRITSVEIETNLAHQLKSSAYLLSKHFDLFGLIEAGNAIDSTTISK